MKLLVVEDETGMARFLRRGLTEEGFAVDLARDGDAADEAVAVAEYDAVILDVMLPKRDGFSLCHSWRAAGIVTPILFLTARDEVSDRVTGLNLGADDYLVKPFAFEELLARLHALLRRGKPAAAEPVLRVDDLVVDPVHHRVTRGGRDIPLSQREFQFLEYMARNPGVPVTRTALWEHVWPSDEVPDSNVVDVYVRYIRNKLGRDPDLIQTIRGVGYVLAAPGERWPGAPE